MTTSEGHYGCVVMDSLAGRDCGGAPVALHEVVKVFRKKETADRERKLAELVRKIDPEGHMFSVPSRFCRVDVSEAEGCSNMPQSGQLTAGVMSEAGRDLHSEMAETKATPSSWRRILRDCLAATAALHAADIAHHDIRPANVMLRANATRIIDFGLALLRKEVTSPEKVARFPGYYAYPPEHAVIRGREYPGAAHLRTTIGRRATRLVDTLLCEGGLDRAQEAAAAADPATMDPWRLAVVTDSWMLGITFAETIVRLADDPAEIAFGPECHAEIDALRLLMHPDPSRRATPAEVIEDLLAGDQ